MKLNRKTLIFLSAIMSIVSVFVCAVSTLTWFQLTSQPLQTSIVSGSGNVSLVSNSTYGYKINPEIGADGKINYNNTTVTKKNGSTISTQNNNLDGQDTDFDVPTQGIGYYLIEQNAKNTFTYSYNSTVMATKFITKTGSAVNAHYIASKTLSAKKYRVKKYTFVNNKTVYEQVPIKATNSSQVALDVDGDNPTYDITITSAGTYKIWLNYSSAVDKWDLSLEATSYSPTSSNIATSQEKILTNTNVRYASSTNTQSNIDTGTSFSQIGFEQNNNYTTTADWFLYLYGGSVNTGWPGFGLLDNAYGAQSSVWFPIPSGQASNFESTYDHYVISAWHGRGYETTTLGTLYNNISGNSNSQLEGEYSKGNKNFFKVNGNWSVSTERMSTLSVYHVKDGASSLKDSVGVWNTNSVSSTMSDAGLYTPSYQGYTFNGWYKNSNCTVAFTDGYISHDTSIYAKFTINSPSATTYTTYLYDAAGTTASPTWSNPKVYVWDSTNYYKPVNNVYTYSARTTHNDHYVYQFAISVSYDHLLFRNGDSTGGTNQTVDLAKSDANGKYYVMNSTYGGKRSGTWYSSLASESKYTYYYYDNASTKKLGNTPAAYAWASSGATNDADNYTIYPYQNNSWPGKSMDAYSAWPSGDQTAFTTAHPNVDTSNVWRIITSQSYDKIIFNNGTGGTGNSDQTIDLTTTGHNGYFFVLSGDTSGGKWNGQWAADVYGITLKASFFIKTSSGTSKSSIATQNLGTDYTFGIEPFNASSASYSDIKYGDSINGILYVFSDINSGTSTWYTDEACTITYTARAVTTNVTLYRKFVADFSGSDYKTFYIDASHSGTGSSSTYWQNISICGQGINDTPYFSSNDTGATWKIGSYLYRVTVPASYSIRIANSGYSSSGGNNTTSAFSVSTTVTTDYIVVNAAASGSNCSVTSCTDLSTNIGTATIYVKGPNDNSFTGTVMSIGDQTSNDFVYELGLRVESGSQIYIDRVATDGTTHTYYKYDNYVNDIPSYIDVDTTSGNRNILTKSYEGYARFNFYITHGGKVSIAMVPDYGNGYYIMPYNSTLTTNTYSGAIKMSSGSNVSASYSGFYASAGDEIFIRSYIDAVDTLYTQSTSLATGVYLGTSDGSSPTSPGVLHFTNSGYYDIDVYNGKITVTRYEVGDFFKLNALNTSSVTTTPNIKNQKTSLVIEVAFTCNNSYASKLSLTADNGMSDFVGAALYCTTAAGKLADPYNYLRANAYSIQSTNNVINDSANLVIPANSSATYYAYILVDYLPTDSGGDYDNFLADYTNNIYFYLNATQYIS